MRGGDTMAPEPAVVADEDIDWAYCVNPDCQIYAQQVFHPIDETPLGLDEAGRREQPCGCGDLEHPHQVPCQCGDVMHANKA